MERVLVVDDDPTVSEVVAGYLGRAGFAVDVAADGPAAWPWPPRGLPSGCRFEVRLPAAH